MRSRLPHIGAIIMNHLVYYWLDKNHFGKVRFGNYEDFAKAENGFIHVADTTLNGDGSTRVSTVILFFDHSGFLKIPQLFETMIFSNSPDYDYMFRYPTFKSALDHHKKIVQAILSDLPIPDFILQDTWVQDYAEQFNV